MAVNNIPFRLLSSKLKLCIVLLVINLPLLGNVFMLENSLLLTLQFGKGWVLADVEISLRIIGLILHLNLNKRTIPSWFKNGVVAVKPNQALSLTNSCDPDPNREC